MPHILIFIRAAALENQQSAYAITKAQISCAVTAQLNSAIVFATQIVEPLFFLNPKFQASSLTSWIVSDFVGTPNCWFSHAKAHTDNEKCGCW